MINSQTDQENYKTEFVRDQRGQKIKEISPTSTKHYSYDEMCIRDRDMILRVI